jgi:hypothetical protein
MALIIPVILVSGICVQMIITDQPTKEASLSSASTMTSIIEPGDLTSDVLQLIRMDPQSHDVVGETPYPNSLPPSKPRSTKLA